MATLAQTPQNDQNEQTTEVQWGVEVDDPDSPSGRLVVTWSQTDYDSVAENYLAMLNPNSGFDNVHLVSRFVTYGAWSA